MRFHYDKKVDALYIRFQENSYHISDPVNEDIILDYDRSGKLIGIEVLNASKRFSRSFRSQFSKEKVPVELEMLRGISVSAQT